METEAKVRDNKRSGTHLESRPDAPLAATRAPKDSADMADTDPITGRSPAFQFYPNDFLSDANVIGMSLQERGAYITLLCLCWQQGTLPSDTERLARLCGSPLPAFRKLWPALEPCFREEGGRLVHPRLEREREKQQAWRDKSAAGGRKSQAKRHQEPTTLEPPLQPRGNQTPTLQSSSSSSSSDFSQRAETPTLQNRAGKFCEWYADKHDEVFQVGYIGNPQKDYQTAMQLAGTFTDAEMQDAALVWFGMDDDWARSGTRTIPRFASRATKCVEIARKVGA